MILPDVEVAPVAMEIYIAPFEIIVLLENCTSAHLKQCSKDYFVSISSELWLMFLVLKKLLALYSTFSFSHNIQKIIA